jgi:dihydroflavonol-4-reductase
MGPGDPDPHSPHNRLYATIANRTLRGCFAGGLAVADVRDLASIIVKALSGGKAGEKYLVVGANVPYTRVVRAIGECLRRPVYPWRLPAPLLTAAGACLELASLVTGRRPTLTRSYGRLSGWYGYYANGKSIEAFDHRYIPFEQTITDACTYFREHYGPPPAA